MMEKSDRIVEGQNTATGGAYFADYIDKSHGTSRDEIDDILIRLHQRKDEWVKLPIIERLDLPDGYAMGCLSRQ